jgi:uncharacterized Zn-binding protein involved in type VI secretion
MSELGAVRATEDMTLGQGHNWTPVAATSGSPNVIVNGQQAVRVGDPFPIHYFIPGSPLDPHDSVAAQGSTTVFANGLALSRGPSQGPASGGDETSCSDTIGSGSQNVIVGG